MAANTSPIFTNVPQISFASITGVDGSSDGTDADVQLVFTADATDGSFIHKLLLIPRSTSGTPTTSVAVAHIYINNGSAVGTATNNSLIYETALPATVLGVAATTAVATWEVPLNFQLPPSYRIYVGVTALAANTAWQAVAIGGSY